MCPTVNTGDENFGNRAENTICAMNYPSKYVSSQFRTKENSLLNKVSQIHNTAQVHQGRSFANQPRQYDECFNCFDLSQWSRVCPLACQRKSDNGCNHNNVYKRNCQRCPANQGNSMMEGSQPGKLLLHATDAVPQSKFYPLPPVPI